MKWSYEKLVDGKIKQCPMNDKDASITGSFVFGLKAWFDENPQKARELGWIKHIHPDKPKFNSHTHYLMVNTKTVDEYTVEDVYMVFEKSEEMLLNEELEGFRSSGVVFYTNDDDD